MTLGRLWSSARGIFVSRRAGMSYLGAKAVLAAVLALAVPVAGCSTLRDAQAAQIVDAFEDAAVALRIADALVEGYVDSVQTDADIQVAIDLVMSLEELRKDLKETRAAYAQENLEASFVALSHFVQHALKLEKQLKEAGISTGAFNDAVAKVAAP